MTFDLIKKGNSHTRHTHMENTMRTRRQRLGRCFYKLRGAKEGHDTLEAGGQTSNTLTASEGTSPAGTLISDSQPPDL